MPATTERETKAPAKAPPAGKVGLVLLDKQIFEAEPVDPETKKPINKVGPEHLTKRAGMRMMYDLSHPGARGKKATKHAADKAEARKAFASARANHDPKDRAEAMAKAGTLARKAGI